MRGLLYSESVLGLQIGPAVNEEKQDFAQAVPETLRGRAFYRAIRGRRGVGNNSVVQEHLFHAEKMKTVADDEESAVSGQRAVGKGRISAISDQPSAVSGTKAGLPLTSLTADS